jgi:hypothetical protein
VLLLTIRQSDRCHPQHGLAAVTGIVRDSWVNFVMLQPTQVRILTGVWFGDIYLQHVLYVLKHLLVSRRILEANQFGPISYMSGIVAALLLGEGGGLFVPMLSGRSTKVFKDDYKLYAIIIAW